MWIVGLVERQLKIIRTGGGDTPQRSTALSVVHPSESTARHRGRGSGAGLLVLSSCDVGGDRRQRRGRNEVRVCKQ
jgi:hypothetical protein